MACICIKTASTWWYGAIGRPVPGGKVCYNILYCDSCAFHSMPCSCASLAVQCAVSVCASTLCTEAMAANQPSLNRMGVCIPV